MVRWLRWHCPPDTGFEIRTLAVWGRARYLSVTEAPHNTDFHTWMGEKHFCFFQTAETGNRTPNFGVKGSCANHYPRAPARNVIRFECYKVYRRAVDLYGIIEKCWNISKLFHRVWHIITCTIFLCYIMRQIIYNVGTPIVKSGTPQNRRRVWYLIYCNSYLLWPGAF